MDLSSALFGAVSTISSFLTGSLGIQIFESLSWVLISFTASLLGILIIGKIITTYTEWGRQFWFLARDYFSFSQNKKAVFSFLFILFLSLFGVRLSVLFSNWYNEMYNSLQAKDEKAFWASMLVFSVLATIHVSRSLLAYYLQQVLVINWRQSLNEKLLDKWLTDKRFYRTVFLENEADNPDQRIQQDVSSFVATSIDLLLGVVSALVSAVAFTTILWHLSGELSIGPFNVPHGMVFVLFVYILFATVMAFKIGRPLIGLSFKDERLNANYRYSLVRVREYAESIAFYGGEKNEGGRLRTSFQSIVDNIWAIIRRSLKFQGFNLIVSQTAMIFPFVIQASRFFSGQIKLGDMIQTAQAFGTLHDNLSFFRNAYDSFASYRATLNRLSGFSENMDIAALMPQPKIRRVVDNVILENVTIYSPKRTELISHVNVNFKPGDSVLIRGPSGSGKTTLLRAFAGLWPFTEGNFYMPFDRILFLSQKPYLPQGRLIDALYYPYPAPDEVTEEAKEVLEKVYLGHLVNNLDQEGNWISSLSGGEQQRLAFGRILLAKPKVAFIDEATSAMDEGLEFAIYARLRAELPNMTLFSVGHRSTLDIHHDYLLQMHDNEAWGVYVKDPKYLSSLMEKYGIKTE